MKTLMKSVISGIGLLAGLSLAVLADVTPESWTYKDWSVDREVAADKSVECNLTEQTGSLPLLLTVSQKLPAAGPPTAFPTITLVAAVNVGPMAVAETVSSKWRFDGVADVIPVTLTTDYVGQQNTFTVDSAAARPLLAAMARGNHVDVDDDVFGTTTYSLAGFAAVYRKMADWCDFSVEGVL